MTSLLKTIGFRKSGNNYNRPVADGLVQVVSFQSGQYVSMYHGYFTVNLGVYIPCVGMFEERVPRGRAVAEPYCDIRSRLSAVSQLGEDRWWPLDDTASQ